jgi:hypothetical protein
MATLNSIIFPWLIAEYGIDYADFDNHKTATAMIAHVIMTEQLGGYTERTFPAMIDGYRVQQLAFTKMILQQIGIYYALLFEIILPLIISDILSIFSGKANIVSFQFSQARPTDIILSSAGQKSTKPKPPPKRQRGGA